MLALETNQLLATGTAVVTLPILILAHSLMRKHTWGLPLAALVQTSCWWMACRYLAPSGAPLEPSDWVAGAAILGASWLAWMWVYSTLCRGFSLQLMVELQAGPRGRKDLADSYAGGLGLDWMLDKRIDGLERAGLVQRNDLDGDEGLRITPLGQVLARLAGGYKWLVGIGAGG